MRDGAAQLVVILAPIQRSLNVAPRGLFNVFLMVD
jgi:hypothetical protein